MHRNHNRILLYNNNLCCFLFAVLLCAAIRIRATYSFSMIGRRWSSGVDCVDAFCCLDSMVSRTGKCVTGKIHKQRFNSMRLFMYRPSRYRKSNNLLVSSSRVKLNGSGDTNKFKEVRVASETKYMMNNRVNDVSTTINVNYGSNQYQKYLMWSTWRLNSSNSKYGSDIASEENLTLHPEIQNNTIACAIQSLENAYITQIEVAQSKFDCQHILDIIEDHYIYCDVPFIIDSYPSYSFKYNPTSNSINKNQGIILSKILSFAAIHSISTEVTEFLLELVYQETYSYDIPYLSRQSIDAFRSGGWYSVTFPSGLSLLVKRRFLKSKVDRFSPIPRRWNNEAANEGQVKIIEAARKKPSFKYSPGHNENIFQSIQESDEISGRSLFASMKSETDKWKREMKLYFPKQNMFYKKLLTFLQTRTDALKSAGRAGLISYGFLNLTWYTFALMFSWKRVIGSSHYLNSVPNDLSLIRSSLRKFTKVLAVVYVGSQITKLPRLCLAVMTAPIGDRVLKWTEERMKIGEG